MGYSFAFTTGSPFLGGLSRFLLVGMTMDTVNGLAKTIPESVYMCFQMTFAIITPALICGAIADRMKFSALLWFIGLWSVCVYAPIAHWVWGADGFLNNAGVLDFAGGTVVHINSGVAGLMAALVIGKRRGYGHEPMAPHNLVLSVIGASLVVGRVVRVQRRLCDRGQQQRRDGDDRHPDRDRDGGARLDVRRMDL